MKSLKILFLFLAWVVLLNPVNAQDPAPSVNVNCIVDGSSVTSTSFRFDVTIRRTGTTPYDYVKGQYCFSYNTAIRPGGSGGIWTLAILTSDLPTAKRCIITGPSTSTNGVFYLVAPSDNTDEFLISNVTDVLVARVQVTLNVPFEIQPLNLVWRTSVVDPFTKLYYNDHATPTPQSVNVPAGNITYAMTDGNIVLPIELSSFNVLTQGRDVNLIWKTKTEVNSYLFEVQRASSSTSPVQEWITVGSIAASGNSNSPKEYSLTDTELNSGKYNYRLKMIDNDGTFEYSDVVQTEVALPKEYAISQNYPNPFNPATKINYQLPFDSKVTIELYGITGEKMATLITGELASGYYSVDVNANTLNLASGVYLYRISAISQAANAQAFVQVKKLMIMK